jgi:hypothetical protein
MLRDIRGAVQAGTPMTATGEGTPSAMGGRGAHNPTPFFRFQISPGEARRARGQAAPGATAWHCGGAL